MTNNYKRLKKRIDTINNVYRGDAWTWSAIYKRKSEIERALIGALDLGLITLEECDTLVDYLWEA